MLQPGSTAPAHDRILNVARTIADLDGTSAMGPNDIAEAQSNIGPWIEPFGLAIRHAAYLNVGPN
jgi:hypothetical protein